jgi:hypothetical protein
LPLVELANTTNSVKGITKRGIVVQARAASPSILEAFALFMNDDARCGSKPARWRYRVFFTKERMRHEIPEEPARRGSHTSASLCFDGPTEIMDASPLARKAHAHKIHEKAGSISNTCELPWPVRGDMKKRLSTKPAWGC